MRPEASDSTSALVEVGRTFGGKYQLVRLLGEGGMAFVYEAYHQKLQQRVAIKILTPELSRDAELVARFEREARSVAALRTRHVARVIDVDQTTDDVPYIVMEFLEGRDLDAELDERRSLPLAESIDYVLQACAAMLEAHQMGIVHRDLKPANLYLAKDGTDRVVKVLDFGISKVVGAANKLTAAGAVLGTVLYMSPEQVKASADVDPQTDIWSLGVILYELLAGRAPWEGSSQQIAAQIVSHDPPDIKTLVPVPDAVARVIGGMLQRDRAARYSSVRDVVAALAPFAPQGSVGAQAAEQVLREMSQSSRRAGQTVVHKRTMPMMNAPPPPPTPPGGVTPFEAPRGSLVPHSHASTMPLPPSSRTVPTPPRSRATLGIAIGIGVLGAAGIVLTVGALVLRARQRAHDVPTPPTASVTAEPSATPSSSAVPPPSADPRPSTSASSATSEPRPPASAASGTPAAAHGPRRDAGAGKGSTSAPPHGQTSAPASSAVPTHL
ncbi:MAG: protein kinase [Deltaproteobacteria bacterium]|nr:protein kinase [Deltaproteobacteria bacterium]